ncbi:B3 domain-containing protein [Actinidia chinensis var. chinensis]|uniref:B3 domain-containing protein n=1 Tax=Actinidia chinensis var. chinensis TaxID=1590841 RepID=A0A2R6RGI7_ACTCC|nr:B3 domain-containing protein [Actinidia chinensis var. chinensis]
MRRTTYHNAAPLAQDLWSIRKALTLSDVDITHPFLTLPRQGVEDHIVVHMSPHDREHLRNVEHVIVNAQDDDTGEAYVMKLKWRGSYYNLIGKWGKIVRVKGLDVGREIKIRWSNGCLHFSVSPPQNVVEPQIRIVAAPQEQQQWPIKKVLTLSDVDTNHPFLHLARRPVEDHILVYLTQQEREQLRNEEPLNVNAIDNDTGDLYAMKLKWRGSYYNLIGNWGKIVRRKGLGVGKEIKMRWANRCLHFSVPQGPTAAALAVLDQWPIKKALTLSDVDTNHPFLTLPGKAVEDHILMHWTTQAREQLRDDRQLNINAQDFDTGDLYAMKLRWRGSYYNLIGKWGQIIRGKQLHVGKEIRVCWDNGCLLFSVPQ